MFLYNTHEIALVHILTHNLDTGSGNLILWLRYFDTPPEPAKSRRLSDDILGHSPRHRGHPSSHTRRPHQNHLGPGLGLFKDRQLLACRLLHPHCPTRVHQRLLFTARVLIGQEGIQGCCALWQPITASHERDRDARGVVGVGWHIQGHCIHLQPIPASSSVDCWASGSVLLHVGMLISNDDIVRAVSHHSPKILY